MAKPKKKKKAKGTAKKATKSASKVSARGTFGSGGPAHESGPPSGGKSRSNPGGDSMGSARSTIVVNPGGGGRP
tara:strand:+ start:1761 stop:1982 length:222 start_codon:yes stop_codon:yes gene_type:complete